MAAPSLACCGYERSVVIRVLLAITVGEAERASVCGVSARTFSVFCIELAAVVKDRSFSCVLMECSGAAFVSGVPLACGVAVYKRRSTSAGGLFAHLASAFGGRSPGSASANVTRLRGFLCGAVLSTWPCSNFLLVFGRLERYSRTIGCGLTE